MNSWKIIYGNGTKVEENAFKRLYAGILRHTNNLSCSSAENADETDFDKFNLIFVGTEDSNPYLKGTAKDEYVPEGYTLKIEKSKFNAENQIISICGEDAPGVLYGCVDFCHDYLAKAKNTHDHACYFKKLFHEPFAETEIFSAPAVSERGLWSWGYVICDYKGYLDNMADLKLNTVTIWNDFPPVNARDIIEYAHGLGIKVIWGYSWLWENSDNALIDLTDLDGKVQGIIDTYEKCYAPLGGDGIYFQSFTETKEEFNGGVPIAEAAVGFVNKVSARLLEKHPDLRLQFGLHATSVKNRLDAVAKLDERVSVIWEDCGAFPYAYCPSAIENADETAEFTDRLMSINGGDYRFGAVLKGLTCLHWPSFVHQEGEFVLGEHGRLLAEQRAGERKELWRYVQAYWIKNASYALATICRMHAARGGKITLSALVEDGAFSKNIWYPVAIFARMLWAPESDISDILCDTALRDDVVFA